MPIGNRAELKRWLAEVDKRLFGRSCRMAEGMEAHDATALKS